MRQNIVALLALALICVCGVAKSSIVYNVDVTDGSETVFGTITTDGVIGTLVGSDITAWDLTATGPVLYGPHTSSTGVGVMCFSGMLQCGVTASLSELNFTDLSGTAALSFDYFDSLGGYYLTFFAPNPFIVINDYFVDGRFNEALVNSRTGLIGTAVPEPGTFTLLGLAFAGLGFARKRSRQSTAV